MRPCDFKVHGLTMMYSIAGFILGFEQFKINDLISVTLVNVVYFSLSIFNFTFYVILLGPSDFV